MASSDSNSTLAMTSHLGAFIAGIGVLGVATTGRFMPVETALFAAPLALHLYSWTTTKEAAIRRDDEVIKGAPAAFTYVASVVVAIFAGLGVAGAGMVGLSYSQWVSALFICIGYTVIGLRFILNFFVASYPNSSPA